jgi:hypothetical protein
MHFQKTGTDSLLTHQCFQTVPQMLKVPSPLSPLLHPTTQYNQTGFMPGGERCHGGYSQLKGQGCTWWDIKLGLPSLCFKFLIDCTRQVPKDTKIQIQ